MSGKAATPRIDRSLEAAGTTVGNSRSFTSQPEWAKIDDVSFERERREALDDLGS